MKQKTVDFDSDIDNAGYYCQPIWFLSLNLHLLKKLYRKFRRSMELSFTDYPKLNQEYASSKWFKSLQLEYDINNYTNRDNIRDLLLNDILKFQKMLVI